MARLTRFVAIVSRWGAARVVVASVSAAIALVYPPIALVLLRRAKAKTADA